MRALRRTGEAVDVDGHFPAVQGGHADDTAHEVVLRADLPGHPGGRGREPPSRRTSAATSCCSSSRSACSPAPGWSRSAWSTSRTSSSPPSRSGRALDITKTAGGQHRRRPVSAIPRASGLDPAGALAVLFILVAFFWLLTRMREGRKSPPASIHRVCLILFARRGLPQHHRLGEPEHQPARSHPGHRGRGDARRARGDARRPRDDQAVDRVDLRVGARSPSGYTMFKVRHAPLAVHAAAASRRFEGTFSQPNPFAIYLTMLIVMGAALFPHLTQKKKIGMAVLLFFSIVCLYFTFTRSAWIAMRDRPVRGRLPGHAGGSCSGSWSRRHGVAGRVPDDRADVSRTSALHQRRRLLVELAVVALRLLGRRAPTREQGPDHRHRPEHELATRPASRRSRTTTSCARTSRPASSARSPTSRCCSAWGWWPDTRCGSPNCDR